LRTAARWVDSLLAAEDSVLAFTPTLLSGIFDCRFKKYLKGENICFSSFISFLVFTVVDVNIFAVDSLTFFEGRDRCEISLTGTSNLNENVHNSGALV